MRRPVETGKHIGGFKMSKSLIDKLPIPAKGQLAGAVPGMNPLTATTSAFSQLVEAYREYNQIKQVETTKREAIRAGRDVALSRIQAQKEILQQYLRNTFSERADNFNHMFDILDKGLAAGDDKAIGAAMSMIVKQMEINPLDGIGQLMSCNVIDQINDPDVDCIDI